MSYVNGGGGSGNSQLLRVTYPRAWFPKNVTKFHVEAYGLRDGMGRLKEQTIPGSGDISFDDTEVDDRQRVAYRIKFKGGQMANCANGNGVSTWEYYTPWSSLVTVPDRTSYAGSFNLSSSPSNEGQNVTATSTMGNPGFSCNQVQCDASKLSNTCENQCCRTSNAGFSSGFFKFGGSQQNVTGIGQSRSHTFSGSGVYTIEHRMVDGEGNVRTTSVNHTVNNLPPTVDAGAAFTRDERGSSATVTFSASGSDPGNDPLTFFWDRDRDGNYTEHPAGQSFTFDYSGLDGPTTRSYCVLVRDNNNATATDCTTITVNNVAPSANAGGPYAVDEGSAVNLTGSGSDPFPGDTLTLQWDIDNDNNFDEEPNQATRTFGAAGFDGPTSVTRRFRVKDDDGGIRIATATINIANVPPFVNAGPDKTVAETTANANVTFTATASDNGGDTVTFFWDRDRDGNFFEHPAGASYTLNYRNIDGTVNRNYCVLGDDGDGGTDTDCANLRVNNVAPVLSIGGNASINEGSTFTRNGSFTDPGPDSWSATVNYGEGAGNQGLSLSGKSFTLSNVYEQNGAFTITVSVNDGDGGSDTESFVLSVNNVAPTANAGGDFVRNERGNADTVTFVASASDPGSDALTFFWDRDRDGNFTEHPAGKNFTFDYSGMDGPEARQYCVLVRDQDNATDTDCAKITVNNVVPSVSGGGPYNVNEGGSVNVTATASDIFPGDNPVTIQWDTNQNNNFDEEPDAATRSFSAAGLNGPSLESLRVRAKDDDGGIAFALVSVNVVNVPPVVSAGADKAVNESAGSASITLTASATDAGGDSVDFLWDKDGDGFDDGAGATFVFNYAGIDGPGSRQICVRGEDQDGATDTDCMILSVNNVAPTLNLGANATINEGGTFARNGSFTDPGPDSWTGVVNYGAGGGNQNLPLSGKAFGLTHNYDQNGTYTVSVTISDDDGASGSDTMTVTVNNVAPTVNAGANLTRNEGSSFSRAVSFTDPGNDTHSARVNYGGGFQNLGAVTSPFNIGTTYDDNGNRTVTVEVTDSDGGMGSDSFTVTVNNVAPTVNAGAGLTVNEGASWNRQVSFSDPGADTFTATVNYGSGAQALGAVTSPFNIGTTYADDGVSGTASDDEIVTVTVTDDDGGSTTDNFTVTVNNVAPTVNAGANMARNEGQAWTRAVSFSDPGADTFTATVDYGDPGASDNLGAVTSPFNVGTTYSDDGVRTVTLTVVDDDTGVGTDSFTVTVNNVAPTVNVGAGITLDEGDSFARAVSFSDPGADTHTASVNYGAGGGNENLGAVTSPFNVGATYNENGTYTVTVTVTDDDGGVGNDSLSVTVNNVAPTVNAGANLTRNEGSSFSRAVSFTDPGNDTHTARVNYGAGFQNLGAVTSPFNVGTTYDDNGTNTVTVEVTDDDGGVGTDSFVVTVNNVAPTVNAGPDVVRDESSAFTQAVSFTDPGADTHTGEVDYGAGFTPLGAVLSPFNVGTTYDDEGVNTVTVRVTDDDGGVGTDSFTVTVNNVAPSVDAGPDGTIDEGSAFVSAGSFVDPGADVWTATVNYGDGSGLQPLALAGKTFALNHVYADNGGYTITVTVDDGDGGVGSDTTLATVDNVAPIVTIDPDKVLDEGTKIVVSGAITDPGADTFTMQVIWGDGTAILPPRAVGRNFTADYVYADDDAFTVSISVLDDDGGAGVDTLTADVANVAPSVDAGPDDGTTEGQVWSLAPATFNDKGTLDTHTATIDWGDGSAIEAGVVTEAPFGPPGIEAGADGTIAGGHVYADDGLYTVRVTVTDDDGGSTSDTLEATVTNADPTLAAGGDITVTEGDVVNLAPSTFNDKGTLDVHTATIDWGAGAGAVAGTVTQTPVGPPGNIAGQDGSISGSFVYADQGTFTVEVVVTDDDGGSATDSFTVTVENAAPTVDAGVDQVAGEGALVMLAPATFNDGGTADTHTATVSWGDGTPVEAGNVTENPSNQGNAAGLDGTVDAQHVYADNGTYTVTVTVLDDDGASGVSSLTVTVNNVAPVVDAGADRTLDEGSLLSLAPATFSDAGTADTHTATVNWGDTLVDAGVVTQTPTGPPGDVAGQSGSVAGSHIWADNGAYTVEVCVTDDDSAQTCDSFVATVNNVAPTLEAGVDLNGDEGGVFSLAPATFNDLGTADVHTATIDWGDGSAIAAGAVTEAPTGPGGDAAGTDGTIAGSHVYADNGTYTVSVVVTDDDGASATDSLTATVDNVAPTLNAGVDQVSTEGSVVSLAPASFNDPGTADVHAATINWGDGTAIEAGAVTESPSGPPGDAAGLDGTIAGSHVYADNGVYTVTVVVTDDEGASDTDSLVVTVNNAAPTVNAGPDFVRDEGMLYALAPATFNDLGTADTHTATVDWGDGTALENGFVIEVPTGAGEAGNTAGLDGTVSAMHRFADDGVYSVTVTVTDDEGAQGADTLAVTVNNVAPTVEAGANQTVAEGTVLSLDPATWTDPGFTYQATSETFTTLIQWGDSTSEVGNAVVTNGSSGVETSGTLSADHVYADNGSYKITVTVTDDDGGATADELTVTVQNVAPVVVAGADQITDEGTQISLDPATFHDEGTADTHTALIEWGDTIAEAGIVAQTPSGPPGLDAGQDGTVSGAHTYADDGVSSVKITVTDDDGASHQDSFNVTVNNVNPTIDAGGVATVDEGDTLALPTVNFTDPGYDWAPLGTVESFSATVDFDDGNSATPAPAWTSGSAGVLTTGTVDVSHHWIEDGVYNVAWQVIDDNGGVGADVLVVTVNNSAPVLIAGDDQAVDEGSDFGIVNASLSDPGLIDTFTGTVDWGDGSAVEALAFAQTHAGGADDPQIQSITQTHRFCDDGVYTASVEVADDEGATASGTFEVAVANVPPVVLGFGDVNAFEGGTPSIDVDFTDAGGCDTHTATIDWGHPAGGALAVEPPQGPQGAGIAQNPHFAVDAPTPDASGVASGSLFVCDNFDSIIEVCVTDDDNATTCVSQALHVENVAPAVTFVTETSPLDILDVVLARGSASDRGTCDDFVFASVDWGDGSPREAIGFDEQKPAQWDPAGTVDERVTSDVGHVFFQGGTFLSEICFQDDDGAETCDVLGTDVNDDTGMRIFTPEACRPIEPGPNTEVVTVETDGSGDFDSINDAIDHLLASPAEQRALVIGEGTYEEFIQISVDQLGGTGGEQGNRPPFQILSDCVPAADQVSAGERDFPVLSGASMPIALRQRGVIISGNAGDPDRTIGIDGLVIEDFGNHGVHALNASARITNVITRRNRGNGMLIEGSPNSVLNAVQANFNQVAGIEIKQSDDSVVNNATANSNGDSGLKVRNSNDVQVNGGEFNDNTINGVVAFLDQRFSGGVNGVIVSNVRALDNFEENIFFRDAINGVVSDSVAGRSNLQGIVGLRSHNLVVEGNVSRGNDLAGIHIEESQGSVVLNNYTSGNFTGVHVLGSQGIVVWNNLLDRDRDTGVTVRASAAVSVEGNTVDMPTSQRAGIFIKEGSCPVQAPCQVRENIAFAGGLSFALQIDANALAGVAHDHNLFWGAFRTTAEDLVGPGFFPGANTQIMDPGFADARKVLLPGSPAVDAGGRTAEEAGFNVPQFETPRGTLVDGSPDLPDSPVDLGYHHEPDRNLPDGDGDGVHEALDNCPFTKNAAQDDSNGDGVGDACTP